MERLSTGSLANPLAAAETIRHDECVRRGLANSRQQCPADTPLLISLVLIRAGPDTDWHRDDLGGFGYLSGFVLPVLGIVPPEAVSVGLMAVTLVSEFAFMFWLILKGAGSRDVESPAALI